jgi:hypothetical protein
MQSRRSFRLWRSARLSPVILPPLAALLLESGSALAGPPYNTDDPEPVAYRHWELYLASQHLHNRRQWAGTAPHFEGNYGVVPNVQLHLIAPVGYVAPVEGKQQYGYGDTELGVKLRFIQEGAWVPQVGVFPFVELPTGSRNRGLGNGRAQVYLPLWLQKSFGKWTTYGGLGYWINPSAPEDHNRNWGYFGWQVQRQIFEGLTVGAEVFHSTPPSDNARHETRCNVGAVIDFSDHHHLLLSAGRALLGPTLFAAYAAYQLTFGPSQNKPGG